MERKKRPFKIQNFIIMGVVGIFCFSLVPTLSQKWEEESIRESLMNSFSTLGSIKQKGEDKIKKTTKNDMGSVDLTFSSSKEENKEEENDKKQEDNSSNIKKENIDKINNKTDEKKDSNSANATPSNPGKNPKPEEEKTIDGKPNITFTNTPSKAENNYVKKQVAHIQFAKSNRNYYVKSSKVGVSNIALLESCGSKEKPENCTKIASTKNVKANTWYKVSGNIDITYETEIDTNEHIYAIEKDTKNFSSMAGETLLKITKQSPTQPVILNTLGEKWTNENIRLTFTSNDKVGIAYWEYSYDNKNFTKYSHSQMSTFTTPLFTEEQDRILYIRACNYLGSCSLSTSTRIRIEKTGAKLSMDKARYTITSNSIRFFGVETDGGKSGIREVTCKYSTKKGNYTQNASSVVGNACEMRNLKAGTNYYFAYCVVTNAGNKTCAYGSARTKLGIATPAIGTRGS